MTPPAEPLARDSLTIVDRLDRRDIQFLEDRIDEENMSRTGITDARLLTIFLRDRHGGIVAGLHGWTWGGCCEVRTIWVQAQWRRRGVGTSLMTAAEVEARARGARQIVLSTHSFQAPDFYGRLGFETVGHVDDYPAGHRSIYLRKRLA